MRRYKKINTRAKLCDHVTGVALGLACWLHRCSITQALAHQSAIVFVNHQVQDAAKHPHRLDRETRVRQDEVMAEPTKQQTCSMARKTEVRRWQLQRIRGGSTVGSTHAGASGSSGSRRAGAGTGTRAGAGTGMRTLASACSRRRRIAARAEAALSRAGGEVSARGAGAGAALAPLRFGRATLARTRGGVLDTTSTTGAGTCCRLASGIRRPAKSL